MKADLLLDRFEQIADAPDAIIRMRHFILDLAMRGKLLETSTKFIPTTLGEVGRWGSGGTPTKSNPAYYGGSIPWLVIGDLNDGVVTTAESYITDAGLSNSSAKIVEPGTVLIAMYGSIGKMGIAGLRCATNQAIAHCVPDQTKISTEYLFLTLKSLSTAFVARGHGGAQQNISQTIIKSQPVSLPSLPEQRRIVAKVEELMGLCDRLEAARSAREGTRDHLAAASLARLDAPDPETFDADARFALDALPVLTTRPDQIKALRRTILNLAVRGKLVPQDASDEPASELLKRIASEKSKLVGAGNTRRDDAGSLGRSDQNDFPIPDSWALVPATFPARGLSDLGKKVQTKDVLASGRFPVVDQGKVLIRGYCNDPEKVTRVDTPIIVFGDHTRETKLIDFDFVVGADGVKLLQPVCIDASYYFLALQWLPLGSRGYGRHFKLLKASTIPLPPLAEQHRIVAKVDELMGLCDRLEASLATASTTRLRLLDALLREALDPVPLDEAA